jgi:hypothetical protein
MNSRFLMVLTGLASVAGAYALARRMQLPEKVAIKEDVTRWESEGGNVPSVPTPST